MRRERAAQQPQVSASLQRLPGPLCGPFATQGRSYKNLVHRPTADVMVKALAEVMTQLLAGGGI
ncbi:hypothetical protein [Pseudomonas asiatica]|uniref:hypothetical protein n=1 Tax=Pseudomonas asiatica TaxID=2219225 RepID=UPI0010C010CB|nr:hypothetical protein [Pseudomonas asiatica]